MLRHPSKVPTLTAYFWITKILTTGMGETTSDWLAHKLNPFIAVGIAGIGLAVSLVFQFSTKRYIPWIYWLAVTMVSVFGTMAADVLHVGFGIPYIVSSAFYAILLIGIFCYWYASEKTLSIHSIITGRRELLYWATVLITFALGTAVGDMTATTMHLGYLDSGILFAGIMIIPVLAYFGAKVNEVFCFWFAYILTRPLGASFADWMGVSHARGGLGIGTGPVSLALGILIVGFVGYMTLAPGKRTGAI